MHQIKFLDSPVADVTLLIETIPHQKVVRLPFVYGIPYHEYLWLIPLSGHGPQALLLVLWRLVFRCFCFQLRRFSLLSVQIYCLPVDDDSLAFQLLLDL